MRHSMSGRYKTARLALVLLLGCGTGVALAQESSALRGEMFIAGKTPIDPPPEEPNNTHAYIVVKGPAALRMYRLMRAKEEDNLCEEGKKMKQAGPLMCSISADRRMANCSFSVDLIKGALADGQAC